MRYGIIDEWLEEFLNDHGYTKKDVIVEVFPQAVTIDGKIKTIQATVIREKNYETVDVYFDEDYRYTLYDPNEEFMKDLSNHELKIHEAGYEKE